MPDPDPADARLIGRQATTRLVIEALRRSGDISQAGIARLTGLSRATVNNVVRALRDSGIVQSTQVNGRETAVGLVPRGGSFVAVEVKSASLHGALFDFAARCRHDAVLNAPAGTGPAMVQALVGELTSRARVERGVVRAVSLAFEAPILRATGTIAAWAEPRLPHWKAIDLVKAVEGRLGVPTFADNDANLAALAEWNWGVGRGCDHLLYVICNEGVGGGLVIDGRIYRGGTGMAGELGHMVVEDDGGVCFCGSRGCLSGFVSERAILAALGPQNVPQQNLAAVIDAARRGDAACRRVLFEAGQHLGKALAVVARVMAPNLIVVGGVLSSAGDYVSEGLQAATEIINLRNTVPQMRFALARIARDEVLLGALAAALAHTDRGVTALEPWLCEPHQSATVSQPPPRRPRAGRVGGTDGSTAVP